MSSNYSRFIIISERLRFEIYFEFCDTLYNLEDIFVLSHTPHSNPPPPPSYGLYAGCKPCQVLDRGNAAGHGLQAIIRGSVRRKELAKQARAPTAPAWFLTHATRRRKKEKSIQDHEYKGVMIF
jgi:hypothetical protein